MFKIVFVLFLLFFVLPSVWSYFYNKKLAKNIKPSAPLTDEQMQALLQPDGKPKPVKSRIHRHQKSLFKSQLRNLL